MDEDEGQQLQESVASVSDLRKPRSPPKGVRKRRNVTKVRTPGSYSLETSSVRDIENREPKKRRTPVGDSDSVVDDSVSVQEISVKRKVNRTNQQEVKSERDERMERAIEKVTEEDMSYGDAAKEYNVAKTSLYDRVKLTYLTVGRGRRSQVFSKDEETKVAEKINERASLGVGLSYEQLAALVQECLLGLVAANPSRKTGLEESEQYPSYRYCLRFAKRNGLVLRSTSELSRGREGVTIEDIRGWQDETYDLLVKEWPELWNDPRRIFNQV